MTAWYIYSTHDDAVQEATTVMYDICAIAIFLIMAYTFLFPYNIFFPLDRRTMSVLSATLVYITRSLAFRDQKFDIIAAVDFDVLVLLASIMCINHIVVNQRETKKAIVYMQEKIQSDPIRGFWLVSFISFAVSPFLTNDGVCLLLVQPICDAFESVLHDKNTKVATKSTSEVTATASDPRPKALWPPQDLRPSDIIYFMLALACSSNIGSTLTYTGNPQNMVLSGDAQKVLPPLKFLAYMILPAIVTWLMTTYYILFAWSSHRESEYVELLDEYTFNYPVARINCDRIEDAMMPVNSIDSAALSMVPLPARLSALSSISSSSANGNTKSSEKAKRYFGSNRKLSSMLTFEVEVEERLAERRLLSDAEEGNIGPPDQDQSSRNFVPLPNEVKENALKSIEEEVDSEIEESKTHSHIRVAINSQAASSLISPPLSPPAAGLSRLARIVSSPLPYMVLVMLFAMIVMIFVDVMSITGLVCISALSMVVAVVIGNHWRGRSILVANVPIPSSDGFVQVSAEERTQSLNDFFDELFNSIDYSLLLIFLGTFVVVANIDSTGIPKYLWDKIVGRIPFKTVGSVFGICCYVLFASQLLGNVAVVQLAMPNVNMLDDSSKKFAWAVISFVATVGGNLTITGSAANIIVAEKSQRIVPSCKLDFFRHYKVCFWITIASCITGGIMIAIISFLDS